MTNCFNSCIHNQNAIKELFNTCLSSEAKYQKLIEIGRLLPPLDPQFKTSQLIVTGCQSIVYLRSFMENGKVYFQAESEALISSGLVYLLIATYTGETPETILKCPPSFIEELGLIATLTPGRSNGLSNIYLRLKQDALNLLINPF